MKFMVILWGFRDVWMICYFQSLTILLYFFLRDSSKGFYFYFLGFSKPYYAS